MTVNPEVAEIEKEEPEEVATRVADPWSVVQESRQAVNPFAKSEKAVATAMSSAPATEATMASPITAPSSSTDTKPPVVTTSAVATISATTTTPTTMTTIPPPTNSIKRSTTPETEQADEMTVTVVTGEPDAKKQKVEEEIVRLRRMSEDYAESERKRSVELLSSGPTNGDGQQDSDGFAFSEDDDDFDVPDIRIYSVLFSNSSENSTSFGIDFLTKNLYL